jgi:hypothetical protein
LLLKWSIFGVSIFGFENIRSSLEELISANTGIQAQNNHHLKQSRDVLYKIISILNNASQIDGTVTEKTIEYLKRNPKDSYESWLKSLIKSTENTKLIEKLIPDYENLDINQVEGTITLDHLFVELRKNGVSITRLLQTLELERLKQGREFTYIGIFPLKQVYNEKKWFTEFEKVNGVFNTGKSSSGCTHKFFLIDFKSVLPKLLPNATQLSERLGGINDTGVETKNIVLRLNEEYIKQNQ